MEANGDVRVALVHDWLTGMRGGEKCLEVLCRAFPQAPLFTLLHRAGSVSAAIENRRVTTSWRLPGCDLVLSFSHCVAKAAVPPTGIPHVCYCFTPMRYAWHMRGAYFDG